MRFELLVAIILMSSPLCRSLNECIILLLERITVGMLRDISML